MTVVILDEESQVEEMEWLEKVIQGKQIPIESPYKEKIEARLIMEVSFYVAHRHIVQSSLSQK